MRKFTSFSHCIIFITIICAAVFAEQPLKDMNDFPGKVRLVLPEIIYASTGVETNVYFDNLILVINPANYIFDVTCGLGIQQSDRWTYTPDGKETGDIPFLLEIRDEANVVIARAHSIIRIVSSCDDVNISCLMIGDSLTQAAMYPQHVLDMCSNSGDMHLTLIGSRGEGLNKFEGYGGWTAKRYATHYTGIAHTGDYRQCGSPFIYKDANDQPVLNFSRYCSEFNNSKAPDVVTILLGCNDIFSENDETIDLSIDKIFEYYDTLIQMIHGLSKDTIIGVIPPPPPAASQDAFGKDEKCGQTSWQYKRNQHRLLERMTEKYGNSEDQKIFLVPVYTSLDCINSYPKDSKTGKLCNSVHPAKDGYNQIGDAIYCWLKAVAYQNIK
jgi:lysophospholipase L1-like esterase